MNVYEVRSDMHPVDAERGFSEQLWLTPEELLDRIRQGESAKDDLSILIELLYNRHTNI